MKPKIKWVSWAVANNFGSYIELHKDLKKYPKLLKEILKHETSHTSKIASWKDFFLDLKGVKGLWKFMIFRPKTWIQLLPIYYWKGKIIYDINHSILWLITLLIIVADYFLIKEVLKGIKSLIGR